MMKEKSGANTSIILWQTEMRNKIWKYFKLAAQAAIKKDDNRHYRLGASACRKVGTTVTSCNGPSPVPNREMHAEWRISKMLDYGATVYVVRVLANGDYGMAMPCQSCIKAMKSKRVKKVYFTADKDTFGILPLT